MRLIDTGSDITVYKKKASCEKRMRPQNARVKKDVKLKVVIKNWL